MLVCSDQVMQDKKQGWELLLRAIEGYFRPPFPEYVLDPRPSLGQKRRNVEPTCGDAHPKDPAIRKTLRIVKSNAKGNGPKNQRKLFLYKIFREPFMDVRTKNRGRPHQKGVFLQPRDGEKLFDRRV